MDFDFLEYKEKNNLIPLEIQDKKNYYYDLSQLENSFIGRIDIFQIANTFFQESAQLITNAISLFEKGYLDNAYYSLRQSLETALTMVYLSDLEKDKRDEELLKWKEKSKFPMYKAMLNALEKQEAIFSDVKGNMGEYFAELEKVKSSLNKYVHKQGFNTFYVSRAHFLSKEKDQAPVIVEFEQNLKQCIGAIAVFRLCIDPFPILLLDEEIYSRTEDLMTDTFSVDFIEKYIGVKNIEKYKQTSLYTDVYDYFMSFERRLPAILDITKNSYIDREEIEEVLSQIHLLGEIEKQAVAIALSSKKVTRIIVANLLIYWFFTDTKSLRNRIGFTMGDDIDLQKSGFLLNFTVDNTFISSVRVGEENFFIEHNEQFETSEFEEFKVNARSRYNEILNQDY